jgi:hypothetical protein
MEVEIGIDTIAVVKKVELGSEQQEINRWINCQLENLHASKAGSNAWNPSAVMPLNMLDGVTLIWMSGGIVSGRVLLVSLLLIFESNICKHHIC